MTLSGEQGPRRRRRVDGEWTVGMGGMKVCFPHSIRRYTLNNPCLFVNGCCSWMIPNHNVKKWLEITKHPVNKWLALEFQDGMIEQHIHPAENERMSTLKKESFQGKNCLPSFIFQERTVSFFLGVRMANICLRQLPPVTYSPNDDLA